MKRITPIHGLKKKFFTPPLEQYMTQIRQICEKYGYKVTGKIVVEMKNKDLWTYTFGDSNERHV